MMPRPLMPRSLMPRPLMPHPLMPRPLMLRPMMPRPQVLPTSSLPLHAGGGDPSIDLSLDVQVSINSGQCILYNKDFSKDDDRHRCLATLLPVSLARSLHGLS